MQCAERPCAVLCCCTSLSSSSTTDPVGTEMLMTRMVSHLQSAFGRSVDVVVGLDSRGFLFGPTLAARMGCAFVPIRKAGKLPGRCASITYQKEYGVDTFEVQIGAIRKGATVVVVDDLLATGGTMKAAAQLIDKVGGRVASFVVVIDLVDLPGRKLLEPIAPVYAILQY
jgi:adenine phosphoribosyltransferase